MAEAVGLQVGNASEVQKTAPLPTETQGVKAQQQARMEEGRRGIVELGKKGIDLGESNEKTPEQIIENIPGWQNDMATQRYVGEAQQLFQEVEAAKKIIQDNLQKSGEKFSEESITVEAERIVFENRVAAATPKGESVVLDVQGEAIQQWVENGALGEEARPLLTYLASRDAVRVAEDRVRSLSSASHLAKTESEKKFVNTQHERALKVLKEARAALERAMKENDRLKTDPQVSDEVRLLAYDIDTRQTAIELREVNNTILQISLTPEEQRDSETQARYDEAEAKRESLTKKQETLQKERGQIGTPEQQQIDYVTAEVIKLTGDIAEIKGKDGNGISAEEQQKREAQRKDDPVGYLQSEIRRVGISNILANSDVSLEDQKKLIALATTKDAEKKVMGDEIKDKSLGVGKTGLMAILLLLYTAHGANKKSKGQQMG